MKYIKFNHKYKYKLVAGYVHENIKIPGFMSVDGFVTLESGTLLLRKGYAWDGPSGPTIDTPDFMRGSLVHDALYQLMREGLLNIKYRPYADMLLRDICLADGMAKWRANYVYWAVRTFAAACAKPSAKEVKVYEI